MSIYYSSQKEDRKKNKIDRQNSTNYIKLFFVCKDNICNIVSDS